MTSMYRGVCAVITLALAACGSGSGGSGDSNTTLPAPADIPATPLAGIIDGRPWTATAGVAHPDGAPPGELFFQLSDATVERVCDAFAWPMGKAEREVLFSVPPVLGPVDTSAEGGQSVTIEIIPGDGATTKVMVSDSSLQIDNVTDTEIKGRVATIFDEANQVQGAFAVKRCGDAKADPATIFKADAVPDAALVGQWQGPMGFSKDWVWTMTFVATGTATAVLTIPVDQVLEDGDETWQTDSSSTPKRLRRQVTKVRHDTNGLEKEGEVKYCVYGPAADDAKKIILECNGQHYPVELPEAADADMILSKI